MRRCSSSPILRSASRTITRSWPGIQRRWTSSGPRTVRPASSTSSRPPETVASRRAAGAFETYTLKAAGRVLATGRAVGEKIASGKIRVVADQHDLAAFHPGEVLVAEATSPDWEPVMKTAAAIVTSRGGRTCHAAIVARELGVPAVVGAEEATERLATGGVVTVSCADGEVGKVYDGALPFEVRRVAVGSLQRPRTKIMVNLGNPELAYHTAMLPNDGVGRARMEFISTSTLASIRWRSRARRRSHPRRPAPRSPDWCGTMPAPPISLSRNWPRGSVR